MRILLTGCAGFIGSHLLERLIEKGHDVVGVDNFDLFYERATKERNLAPYLHPSPLGPSRFDFLEADLADTTTYDRLDEILEGEAPDAIIHCAGKPTVHSSDKPASYLEGNLTPTHHLLDYARCHGIPRFLFASCASVYGQCPELPWKESAQALRPTNPYAATKLCCEQLGKVYSRHYNIRFTALRLFKVYGPRQRPDSIMSRFAESIRNDRPFPLYGAGESCHAYTYIDDVVDGILAALKHNGKDFEVFNLGHPQPISQRDLLKTFENCLGVRAEIEALPEREEVLPHRATCLEKSRRYLGFKPRTPLAEGIRRFAEWFLESHDTNEELPLATDGGTRVRPKQKAPPPAGTG